MLHLLNQCGYIIALSGLKSRDFLLANYITGVDFVIDGGKLWQRGGVDKEM
jgi:hypothetical protein